MRRTIYLSILWMGYCIGWLPSGRPWRPAITAVPAITPRRMVGTAVWGPTPSVVLITYKQWRIMTPPTLDDLIHQVRLRLYLMLEIQEVAAPWMYAVYPEPIHAHHLDHYDSKPWPWWKYIYGDLRELPRALAYYCSEQEAQAHIARNPSHGPMYIRFERYRP